MANPVAALKVVRYAKIRVQHDQELCILNWSLEATPDPLVMLRRAVSQGAPLALIFAGGRLFEPSAEAQAFQRLQRVQRVEPHAPTRTSCVCYPDRNKLCSPHLRAEKLKIRRPDQKKAGRDIRKPKRGTYGNQKELVRDISGPQIAEQN